MHYRDVLSLLGIVEPGEAAGRRGGRGLSPRDRFQYARIKQLPG